MLITFVEVSLILRNKQIVGARYFIFHQVTS